MCAASFPDLSRHLKTDYACNGSPVSSPVPPPAFDRFPALNRFPSIWSLSSIRSLSQHSIAFPALDHFPSIWSLSQHSIAFPASNCFPAFDHFPSIRSLSQHSIAFSAFDRFLGIRSLSQHAIAFQHLITFPAFDRFPSIRSLSQHSIAFSACNRFPAFDRFPRMQSNASSMQIRREKDWKILSHATQQTVDTWREVPLHYHSYSKALCSSVPNVPKNSCVDSSLVSSPWTRHDEEERGTAPCLSICHNAIKWPSPFCFLSMFAYWKPSATWAEEPITHTVLCT